MDTIKLLIADDHGMILDGYRAMLENFPEFEIIDSATTGKEVISKTKRMVELDIIILDINMPEMDGIEVATALKASNPEIKILIVSMYHRKEFIKSLMEVGVDGYVLKNAGLDELEKALRALAAGEPYYSKEVTHTVMKSYQKRKIFDSPLDIDITDREKEIIVAISEGLSTHEIADKLFLSHHTINSHRKSILSKLEVKNVAGIIRFGIQTGIVKGFDLDR